MRKSANSRSRLLSRSLSMRSSTAGKASDAVMDELLAVIASPSHDTAERTAHHRLAEVAGGLAAGGLGEFGRDLRRKPGRHRTGDIASDELRGGQPRAAGTPNAEDGGKPLRDPAEKADRCRRLVARRSGSVG